MVRETYQVKILSRAVVYVSCMYMFVGDEDVDERLRLRDDTIFHLKQEISTMQQRIEDLESELKGQRSPSQIKEGGMYIAQMQIGVVCADSLVPSSTQPLNAHKKFMCCCRRW